MGSLQELAGRLRIGQVIGRKLTPAMRSGIAMADDVHIIPV